MIKPIKPDEVIVKKQDILPDVVIDTFNKLIAMMWNGSSATILQKEVINMLIAGGIDRNEIFSKHYLDVEDIYRKVGWSVQYDKPGYNENYEPTYKFTRRTYSMD